MLKQRIANLYGLYKTMGFRHTCPLCGWRARHFYSAGFTFPVLTTYQVVSAGYRENIRCPRCNSSSRERLMYLYLRSQFHNFGLGKVLHVAPEAKLGELLRKKYTDQYVSLDIDSSRADVVASIEDIPFPDNSFELSICAHVLEHVPDDARAMREFARTLTPSGIAILLVPFSPILSETFEDFTVTEPEDRERVFGQSDHVRIYGMDYTARLTKSNLAVETLLPKDFLSANEIRKYALNEEEPLFICRKRGVQHHADT